jgi:hypothetical protein
MKRELADSLAANLPKVSVKKYGMKVVVGFFGFGIDDRLVSYLPLKAKSQRARSV